MGTHKTGKMQANKKILPKKRHRNDVDTYMKHISGMMRRRRDSTEFDRARQDHIFNRTTCSSAQVRCLVLDQPYTLAVHRSQR